MCERETLCGPVLPVAPAALGQSDIRNLGNEQKSIPLKQTVVVGHIDVPCIVESHIFLLPDFLCLIDRAIEEREDVCPRL